MSHWLAFPMYWKHCWQQSSSPSLKKRCAAGERKDKLCSLSPTTSIVQLKSTGMHGLRWTSCTSPHYFVSNLGKMFAKYKAVHVVSQPCQYSIPGHYDLNRITDVLFLYGEQMLNSISSEQGTQALIQHKAHASHIFIIFPLNFFLDTFTFIAAVARKCHSPSMSKLPCHPISSHDWKCSSWAHALFLCEIPSKPKWQRWHLLFICGSGEWVWWLCSCLVHRNLHICSKRRRQEGSLARHKEHLCE